MHLAGQLDVFAEVGVRPGQIGARHSDKVADDATIAAVKSDFGSESQSSFDRRVFGCIGALREGISQKPYVSIEMQRDRLGLRHIGVMCKVGQGMQRLTWDVVTAGK